VNRASADVPRARFSPEEVVFLTLEFYRRNYIEGLFLSSGIIHGPDETMEILAEIARRLRVEERFMGYIHLKAIPGASPELLDKAGRHCDRLSANVEMPTDADLRAVAPEKSMRTVELTMSAIRDRREEAETERKRSPARPRGAEAPPRFVPAGQSTQMVVGATPTSDAVILDRASRLYRDQRLRRVYYSAYSPIPAADALLPSITPPLIREHRLYQADWLMRFYGFRAEEILPGPDADLALDVDPKLAWALRHRAFFPVDVNRASRAALLRVPGLGVRNVNRLLALRRQRRIRIGDLARLRVALRRARPFIICADHHPGRDGDRETTRFEHATRPRTRQLGLFEASSAARSGEL